MTRLATPASTSVTCSPSTCRQYGSISSRGRDPSSSTRSRSPPSSCRSPLRRLPMRRSRRRRAGPVHVMHSEAEAAALGALTTPGAPPDAAVCDMGGGTLDVVWGDQLLTAAGAGELLTVSVATALGLQNRMAEYVKRFGSFRAEAPHIVHYEDGRRSFVEQGLPADSLGSLCYLRGTTPVPFSNRLSPEEWRSLRLAIKRHAIGANVSRCLKWLGGTPDTLLLCGGAALDAESVRIVSESAAGRGHHGRQGQRRRHLWASVRCRPGPRPRLSLRGEEQALTRAGERLTAAPRSASRRSLHRDREAQEWRMLLGAVHVRFARVARDAQVGRSWPSRRTPLRRRRGSAPDPSRCRRDQRRARGEDAGCDSEPVACCDP